ncbi:caspase family protein [Agrobacterium tumefaciens]|uniref:caspase family protein n=1 Tax=Agrobacterium tumefaciens TaxID=358 RepID=UPI00157318B1|nr:caspase family protein [Agrobacterium tumefaciens]NSZ66977.1 hypothetical protein [Agrobacterium tumefaciens]NTA73352.1 hypothetical protein [Agrobacterium tumefaciens]WIE41140.1 caspase family protein [Agrobacterium tumefaciens]
MVKPLFIAIGVRNAAALQPLPGVIESIDALSAWARSTYDVVVIDDRKERVTINRIRAVLTPDDDEGDPDPAMLLDRDRIVVYFAGHGFAAWPDQYWILSAGAEESRERISANLFRDTLATYGPRQVAFISDACRSAAPLTGTGDAVVNRFKGPFNNPQKDVFYSCQPGKSSYAVPAKGDQPAYLVFSSILIDGLTKPDGLNLDLIMKQVQSKSAVTSFSLAAYLQEKVPPAALEVSQIQTVQCDPGFWPLDHVYTEFSAGGVTGNESGHQWHADLQLDEPPEPPTPEEIADATEQLKARYQTDLAKRLSSGQSQRLKLSRSSWRAPLVQEIGHELQKQGIHEPRLVVTGSPEATVLSRFGLIPSDGRTPLSFTAPALGSRDTTLCLLQAKHSLTLVPLYADMHAIVAYGLAEGSPLEDGVTFLSWLPIYGDNGNPKLLHSAEALKGLSRGFLRPSDAPKIAEQIRYAKHLDPMMGIVAAYLYKASGDNENIRRMAYYYALQHQPIPFDIVMLGDMPMEVSDGRFTTVVPAVAQDLNADAAVEDFAKRATPEVKGEVAGLVPMLRTGWPYLRQSDNPFHQICWKFIDNLAPSPITTFKGSTAIPTIINAFQEGIL